MLLQFLLTTILVYTIGGFMGYWVHWMFHQSWTGPFFKIHKTHHEVMYPAKDFLSEEYREAGVHNTTPWFAMVIIGVMVPVLLLLWKIGVPTLVIGFAAAESALIGILNNWIHDSLHIKGHFLEKTRAFNTWRVAHRVRHANVKCNFGIFSFEWDKVFRTWRKPHTNR